MLLSDAIAVVSFGGDIVMIDEIEGGDEITGEDDIADEDDVADEGLPISSELSTKYRSNQEFQ